MRPRVSIVTLSFNQVDFLEKAIRSVLDQDYPEIDYIVIDPGSTDGSRDLIARYQDRFTRTILEPDCGPADGLNKGLAAAEGEIFGYINADDRLLPGAIAAIVEAFRAHPTADIIYGHGFIEDLSRGTCRPFLTSPPPLSPWLMAHGGLVLLQQSTFFRRSTLRRVGGFNPANRTSWDWELLVDLTKAGVRAHRIDKALSVFTLHENSISGSGRLAQEYRLDQRRMIGKLLGREPGAIHGPACLVARMAKMARDPRMLVLKWPALGRLILDPGLVTPPDGS